MYIVITGNPVDGLQFFGPFEEHEDAVRYAEKERFDNPDWWVAELNTP